jgi:hypothetical protein
MKKPLIAVLTFLLLLSAAPCFAALTQEQKVTDFLALAGLYNRAYAGAAWKKQAFGVDLTDIDAWMAQVKASQSDLEFYDICARYVASLNDFHAKFRLPVVYEAWLPLTLDVYDGKVLIDAIDRTVLDPQKYPFDIGDELISLDGVSAADWIQRLGPYGITSGGNSVSRSRLAAAAIADRAQVLYTYASDTQPGDVATLVIRSNGVLGTFKMDWFWFGIPFTEEGPVPNPSHGAFKFKSNGQNKQPLREKVAAASNRWGRWTGAPAPHKPGKGPKGLDAGVLLPPWPMSGSIAPFGSPFPKFNPPAGFQLRLGAAQTDEFLTGTFPDGSSLIGYIRISTFEPADYFAALQQFQSEIVWFQQNTDALVIDLMGDGGGLLCYGNTLLQYLFPSAFPSIGLAARGTEYWVENLTEYKDFWLSVGQPQVSQVYTTLIQQTQQAIKDHTLTPSMNICTGSLTYPPATDSAGNNLAFTKPILLLTDNFTGSAAEFFSATLQDNGRAFVYGTRTGGGGGAVRFFLQNATPYSEGTTGLADSLAIRIKDISAPGLPTAPLIENIGVLPDVNADFQTRENLLTGGVPFVQGLLATITKLVATGHP